MTTIKSVPYRIDFAIRRLVKAMEVSGVKSLQVGINDGEPGHLSLFDEDGNQDFYWYDDGHWFAYAEVDGD